MTNELRIIPPNEARALVEAATPGPWSRYGTWPYEVFQEPDGSDQDSPVITSAVLREVDTDLIAAAPDLAHTAAVLGEQVAAITALHEGDHWCGAKGSREPEHYDVGQPCPTASALGVTG